MCEKKPKKHKRELTGATTLDVCERALQPEAMSSGALRPTAAQPWR